jgi:hypothetical protein
VVEPEVRQPGQEDAAGRDVVVGTEDSVLDGGCSTSSPGGVWSANWPGCSGWSPSAGPRHDQTDRARLGLLGSSSRTRNTVLTGSRPGTAAICTASTRNLAHSTVSIGQRLISMNPYSDPSDCSGATSIDGRPSMMTSQRAHQITTPRRAKLITAGGSIVHVDALADKGVRVPTHLRTMIDTQS